MRPTSVLPMLGMTLALLSASCGKKETPTEPNASSAPVAVTKTEAAPVPEANPAIQPGEGAAPLPAIPVEDQSPDEEEPSAPDTDLGQPTPGQRLDHAIEKTGQALQTAGEKTEQGVRTAAEKTEEGLRKAAEKTGGFLQKAGEKLQQKAQEGKESR